MTQFLKNGAVSGIIVIVWHDTSNCSRRLVADLHTRFGQNYSRYCRVGVVTSDLRDNVKLKNNHFQFVNTQTNEKTS